MMTMMTVLMLQNHYPERLGVLILVDAPFLFRAFWKVISPFVDAKTLKKVVFVSGSDKDKRKVLEVRGPPALSRPLSKDRSDCFDDTATHTQEYIDLKDLPAVYAGDSDFVFDADEYIAWLKKGEEEEREKQAKEGEEQQKESDPDRKAKEKEAAKPASDE
jgi:hypothetical protein